MRRYVALGVRIFASNLPLLDAAVMAAGMRPINNVVDKPTMSCWRWGNLSTLCFIPEGRKIIVRRARSGEKLVTLDGTHHDLDEEMRLPCSPAVGWQEWEVWDESLPIPVPFIRISIF